MQGSGMWFAQNALCNIHWPTWHIHWPTWHILPALLTPPPPTHSAMYIQGSMLLLTSPWPNCPSHQGYPQHRASSIAGVAVIQSLFGVPATGGHLAATAALPWSRSAPSTAPPPPPPLFHRSHCICQRDRLYQSSPGAGGAGIGCHREECPNASLEVWGPGEAISCGGWCKRKGAGSSMPAPPVQVTAWLGDPPHPGGVLRAHREGSARQLWHGCHRFAVTGL